MCVISLVSITPSPKKIVTDEERLYEMVPMLMINFKYAIVTEELKHMLYALQDPALAHDNEKCDSLMQRYNELRTVQSIMAKRLGRSRRFYDKLICLVSRK